MSLKFIEDETLREEIVAVMENNGLEPDEKGILELKELELPYKEITSLK